MITAFCFTVKTFSKCVRKAKPTAGSPSCAREDRVASVKRSITSNATCESRNQTCGIKQKKSKHFNWRQDSPQENSASKITTKTLENTVHVNLGSNTSEPRTWSVPFQHQSFQPKRWSRKWRPQSQWEQTPVEIRKKYVAVCHSLSLQVDLDLPHVWHVTSSLLLILPDKCKTRFVFRTKISSLQQDMCCCKWHPALWWRHAQFCAIALYVNEMLPLDKKTQQLDLSSQIPPATKSCATVQEMPNGSHSKTAPKIMQIFMTHNSPGCCCDHKWGKILGIHAYQMEICAGHICIYIL